MKRIALMCVVLAVTMLVCVSGSFADRADDCKALVEKALSLFKTKGKPYALKLINSNNVLTDREIYVFAISLDNTVLAHPYMPSLVGKNMNDETDSDGKYFFREFSSVAQDGGSGWVTYWWRRAGNTAARFKKSYIKRVPGEDLYIGAGYYPASKQ